MHSRERASRACLSSNTAVSVGWVSSALDCLASVAQLPASLWWPLLAFLINLLLGPWMLACVGTTGAAKPAAEERSGWGGISGAPDGAGGLLGGGPAAAAAEGGGGASVCRWGLMTTHGIYMAGRGGKGWELVSTQDMRIIANVHMVGRWPRPYMLIILHARWGLAALAGRSTSMPCHRHSPTLTTATLLQSTCVLPVMLWMLSVVGRWRRQQQQPLRQGGGTVLSLLQVVALLGLLCLHALILARFAAGFGCLSILLSPGIGWVFPCLGLWLGLVRFRMLHRTCQCRERCKCC